MKTRSATFPENSTEAKKFGTILRTATREMAAIHRANKASDVEIRRLQISTRKILDRIQENLRHVQAAR